MSPADNRRLNPKQQNNYNRMNLTTNPTCLSLRNNAACCIPLCVICVICGRIFTQEYSIYIAQMKTQKSPADLADLRRQNPKQQNSLTSRNCLSLRYNAACCIPLRHLRYLRENIHMRVLNVSAQGNPNVSRRFR
jgi:hypothetical protein